MGGRAGRVETEGWGARLLACQDADGQWAGGAFCPGDFDRERWRSEPASRGPRPASRSAQLREFGLDPRSERAAGRSALVGANARWEEGGQPFWEGEVEECINGRTVADGAYLRRRRRGRSSARLLGERPARRRLELRARQRLEALARSTRRSTCSKGCSSTRRATGGSRGRARRAALGEAFLLDRRLCRRLSTGAPADRTLPAVPAPEPLAPRHPARLDYFRDAAAPTGAAPDPRLGEAIAELRRRQLPDGRWPLDWTLRGGRGSTSTTAPGSRRAGSRSARCGCCVVGPSA